MCLQCPQFPPPLMHNTSSDAKLSYFDMKNVKNTKDIPENAQYDSNDYLLNSRQPLKISLENAFVLALYEKTKTGYNMAPCMGFYLTLRKQTMPNLPV